MDAVPKKVLNCVFDYPSIFLIASAVAFVAIGSGPITGDAAATLGFFIAAHFAGFAFKGSLTRVLHEAPHVMPGLAPMLQDQCAALRRSIAARKSRVEFGSSSPVPQSQITPCRRMTSYVSISPRR